MNPDPEKVEQNKTIPEKIVDHPSKGYIDPHYSRFVILPIRKNEASHPSPSGEA